MKRRLASFGSRPRALRLLPLLASLLLLAVEGSALAAVALNGVVDRPRQRDAFLFYISKSDCETDDDTWTFTFKVDIDATKTFQVWVSDTLDCEVGASRTNVNGAVCKQVGESTTVSVQNQHTVTLTSRQLAPRDARRTFTKTASASTPRPPPSRATSRSHSST
ncbi:MAG: hypothetical protein R3B70_26870 [Polyangiaceae bacterium]